MTALLRSAKGKAFDSLFNRLQTDVKWLKRVRNFLLLLLIWLEYRGTIYLINRYNRIRGVTNSTKIQALFLSYGWQAGQVFIQTLAKAGIRQTPDSRFACWWKSSPKPQTHIAGRYGSAPSVLHAGRSPLVLLFSFLRLLLLRRKIRTQILPMNQKLFELPLFLTVCGIKRFFRCQHLAVLSIKRLF